MSRGHHRRACPCPTSRGGDSYGKGGQGSSGRERQYGQDEDVSRCVCDPDPGLWSNADPSFRGGSVIEIGATLGDTSIKAYILRRKGDKDTHGQETTIQHVEEVGFEGSKAGSPGLLEWVDRMISA